MTRFIGFLRCGDIHTGCPDESGTLRAGETSDDPANSAASICARGARCAATLRWRATIIAMGTAIAARRAAATVPRAADSPFHHEDAVIFASGVMRNEVALRGMSVKVVHAAGQLAQVFLAAQSIGLAVVGGMDYLRVLEWQNLEECSLITDTKVVLVDGRDDCPQFSLVAGCVAYPAAFPAASQRCRARAAAVPPVVAKTR